MTTTTIIIVNAISPSSCRRGRRLLVRLAHRLPETAPHHDELWGAAATRGSRPTRSRCTRSPCTRPSASSRSPPSGAATGAPGRRSRLRRPLSPGAAARTPFPSPRRHGARAAMGLRDRLDDRRARARLRRSSRSARRRRARTGRKCGRAPRAAMPEPVSATSITSPKSSTPSSPRSVVRLGVLQGILEQRVERDAQAPPRRRGRGRKRAARAARRAARPRSSARRPPRGSSRVDLGRREERGWSAFASSSRREIIRSMRASSSTATASSGCRRLPAMQVEMTARDRDRRSQLVRDVVQEPLLPHDERLGGAHGRLPAPCVPHHREEHRRHERHLEELAPELDPLERVGEDRGARGDDDRAEHQRRRLRLPDAEAVDERQADPDEMERDRLPARPDDHRRRRSTPRKRPTRPRPCGYAARR